jgi:Protein of unknown function (DUF2726)
MQQALPWILASLSMALLLGAAGLWVARRRESQTLPLPTEWTLTARPVFSTDERRIYRQLREALPHHIVLSKLPLVRFCQPTDPQEVRFWYDLLGSSHVTFAVCSANGRVLAAVDLDSERAPSRRSAQIKQSVLSACRVRYMRCPSDHLPSIPELQLLVPSTGAAGQGLQPAPTVNQVRENLVHTVAARRRERTTLWQDSGFMQDSFFGADGRTADGGTPSGFGAPRPTPGAPEGKAAPATAPGGLLDLPIPRFRH